MNKENSYRTSLENDITYAYGMLTQDQAHYFMHELFNLHGLQLEFTACDSQRLRTPLIEKLLLTRGAKPVEMHSQCDPQKHNNGWSHELSAAAQVEGHKWVVFDPVNFTSPIPYKDWKTFQLEHCGAKESTFKITGYFQSMADQFQDLYVLNGLKEYAAQARTPPMRPAGPKIL